jgi:hypothetical protein
MRWSIALPGVVFGFSIGCGSVSGPPNGLSHALAMNTCGPADGAATSIYLAGEPIEGVEPSSFPYVRIAIWHGVTQLAGGSFRVDTDAAALYVTGPDTFEIASGGSVTVERVGASYRIDGVSDLRFPSRRVLGTFSANWVQLELLCG